MTPNRIANKNSAAVVFAFSQYLALGLTSIAGVIMARALGPAGRGQLASWQSASVFGSLVLGLGIPSLIRGTSAKAVLAVQYLYWVRRVSISAVLITTPTFVILAWAHLISIDAAIGLAILFFTVAIASWRNALRALCQSDADLRGIGRGGIAAALTVLLLACAIATAGSLTVRIAMIVFCAGIASELLVYRRSQGLHRSAAADAMQLMPVLRRSVFALPAQLAEASVVRVDQLLLPLTAGATQAGLYAAAVAVAGLPIVMVQVAVARGSRHIVDAISISEKALFVRRMAKEAVGLTALASIVACPLALLISQVFGSPYRASAGLALALLAANPLVAVAYVATYALQALGRPGYSSVLWVPGLVVYGVLFLPMTMGWKAWGAVGCSALAYALCGLGGVVLVRRALLATNEFDAVTT